MNQLEQKSIIFFMISRNSVIRGLVFLTITRKVKGLEL